MASRHQRWGLPTGLSARPQPIPTHACLVCTAKMTRHEGRKVYLSAEVHDAVTETLLADATSLFISLKAPLPSVDIEPQAKAAPPLGELDVGLTDVSQWHEAPRYQSLCNELGL